MKDGHFLAKEKLPEHNLAHDVKRRDYRCGKGVVERLDEPHKTEIQSKIRSDHANPSFSSSKRIAISLSASSAIFFCLNS